MNGSRRRTFRPAQSVSKEAGGLNTAIGYHYHEDKYENGTDHVFRQNQVYSHLGYGARNWEIYGRIGGADLKISDAFRSTQASTATSKNDFDDNWKIFGTLGAKGFYPFNKTFGSDLCARFLLFQRLQRPCFRDSKRRPLYSRIK